MSGEIKEIGEDSKISTTISSKDAETNDVNVAVGKNDLHVVQWALDHAISPGFHIFLVHIFPPINYIPTPVGNLRSQLSKMQEQVYINEESNRRKNLLEKYIRLCNDAKVAVLVKSNSPAEALLDLIPIVNITSLVIGTSQSRPTRLARKGQDIAEYV